MDASFLLFFSVCAFCVLLTRLLFTLQVGSMFMSSLRAVSPEANVWILCEQFQVIAATQRPKVIVGTPEDLESILMTFSTTATVPREHGLNLKDVEAIVVDEIHNLSKYASMERIIHLLPQAFVLGLSATMGNPQHLHKWLASVKKDRPVHLEVVSQRFFNLQQYVFNATSSEFIPISPLASITPETLSTAAKSDIPFTPFETVRLYNAMKPWIEKHDLAEANRLSPSNFFRNLMKRDNLNRVSLGQAREYGRELVQVLSALSTEAQADVFQQFKLGEVPEQVDVPRLVQQLMRSRANMLPALAFNLDSVVCFHSFHELLQKLEFEDNLANPDRRARLRKQGKDYQKALRKWESAYDRLNSDQQRMEYERDNPRPSPPDDEDTIDPNFVVGPPKVGKSDVQLVWDSLCDVMTEKYFDKARKDLRDFMAPYIEGLRRGIGLYTKHMPVFYLRVVQRLAQQGQLGLVFSDDSLAHGVNMPFRTVMFLGDDERLNPLMVQQMAGRAGRRGLDRAGNVIYVGFKAQRITQLMSVTSPDVTGTDVRNPFVAALSFVPNGQEEGFVLQGLKSTFFNPLCDFNDAGRSEAEEKAHIAASTDLVRKARALVEKVPLQCPLSPPRRSWRTMRRRRRSPLPTRHRLSRRPQPRRIARRATLR